MGDVSVVTGGAGFIGSHLVRALVARGDRVRVLDDLSTGRRENLPPGVELVQGSVADRRAFGDAFEGAGVVYHLAAMASVARSLEEPLLCHAVCATGTLNVVEAARHAGVKRVVYAASSSAYGTASDPAGQGEATPLEPLSPYAAAKLAGEHYLAAASASFGLETVRLRFFNIFGPRQRADSPYSGVIAIFTGLLTAGRTPVIHGDGQQSRDFVYVENCVDAILRAGSTPGVGGEVFNVGTGTGVSVVELVAALNRVIGTDITPEFGPARTGDVRFSLAKIGRIGERLGYEPRVSFEEGLRRTVEWYRAGGVG